MGCIYAVLYCVFPNTVASLDISKDLSNQLYDKYISKFRKTFSFDLIHFSNSFIADETKYNLLKKLIIEFNKLDIKKLSFWTGYATDYVSIQLAYYIFAKLINPDYQFCIKKTELKICFYEIDFDFTDENIEYLLNNVGCIVGEWHLGEIDQKIDFRHFRDKYLKLFKNVEVFSVDGVNIKWDLYNDHFIEYYQNVIFHISNN